MPLRTKGGRKCVEENMKELSSPGAKPRPRKQKIAIAHRACGMSKKKRRSKK